MFVVQMYWCLIVRYNSGKLQLRTQHFQCARKMRVQRVGSVAIVPINVVAFFYQALKMIFLTFLIVYSRY